MFDLGRGTNLYSNTAVTNTKIDITGVANRKIISFLCFNSDATNQIFIQFFNATSANVTLGTTVPTLVIAVPAKGSVFGQVGAILFSTAISIAATATATGNGAPATAQIVQFEYI